MHDPDTVIAKLQKLPAERQADVIRNMLADQDREVVVRTIKGFFAGLLVGFVATMLVFHSA